MEMQRHVVFRRKYCGNTASCSFYKTIGLPAVKFRKIFSEPNFCPPSTNLDKQNTVFIELREFFSALKACKKTVKFGHKRPKNGKESCKNLGIRGG